MNIYTIHTYIYIFIYIAIARYIVMLRCIDMYGLLSIPYGEYLTGKNFNRLFQGNTRSSSSSRLTQYSSAKAKHTVQRGTIILSTNYG